MLLHIVDDKPDITREKIACNTCRKYRLCIRNRRTEGVESKCRKCYREEKEGSKYPPKYASLMYCGICGHLSTEEDIKCCSICEKGVGQCCGALYHCQSTECTCKMCYDYTCEQCEVHISKDRCYVSDAGIDSGCSPLCNRCSIRASL